MRSVLIRGRAFRWRIPHGWEGENGFGPIRITPMQCVWKTKNCCFALTQRAHSHAWTRSCSPIAKIRCRLAKSCLLARTLFALFGKHWENTAVFKSPFEEHGDKQFEALWIALR